MAGIIVRQWKASDLVSIMQRTELTGDINIRVSGIDLLMGPDVPNIETIGRKVKDIASDSTLDEAEKVVAIALQRVRHNQDLKKAKIDMLQKRNWLSKLLSDNFDLDLMECESNILVGNALMSIFEKRIRELNDPELDVIEAPFQVNSRGGLN